LASTTIVSIVDDDAAVRTATQTFVRSLGYKATVFASAEDFLKAPECKTADCLIADIQMPGMSGFDLHRELARQRPNLPIIFISAFPEEQVRQQAMAGGATCLLSKPFDGDMLIACIEKALAAKSRGSAGAV
jgi:FixJ family two-component response regulator